MSYDTAGRLKTLSDGAHTLTYTKRTADGRPLAADYSNGIKTAWKYTAEGFVQAQNFTKGPGVLATFNVTYTPQGRRLTLGLNTGESFTYGYDSKFRLETEDRTLNGVTTQTRYAYDDVGTRLRKTVDNQIENYIHNARYELERIEHAGGTASKLWYDKNGTISRIRTGMAAQTTIRYLNLTGETRQCTLVVGGQDIGKRYFPPTTTEQPIGTLNLAPISGVVRLEINADDAVASAPFAIDVLTSQDTETVSLEAENPTSSSGVSSSAHEQAPGR